MEPVDNRPKLKLNLALRFQKIERTPQKSLSVINSQRLSDHADDGLRISCKSSIKDFKSIFKTPDAENLLSPNTVVSKSKMMSDFVINQTRRRQQVLASVEGSMKTKLRKA